MRSFSYLKEDKNGKETKTYQLIVTREDATSVEGIQVSGWKDEAINILEGLVVENTARVLVSKMALDREDTIENRSTFDKAVFEYKEKLKPYMGNYRKFLKSKMSDSLDS